MSQDVPSKEPHALEREVLDASGGDQPLGMARTAIEKAAEKDAEKLEKAGGDDHEVSAPGSGGKTRGRVLGAVKNVAKGVAKTFIGVDNLSAKAGRQSAKNRRGAASNVDQPSIAGPIEFKARYNGEKGFIYLTTDAKSPCVCFTKAPARIGDGEVDGAGLKPAWVLPVADIRELNKYSGYGSKSKLLAGWALDREIMDGVEITDRKGDVMVLTAVPRRDELFNRLCTMGEQKWEIW
jgi:hypothetical protein